MIDLKTNRAAYSNAGFSVMPVIYHEGNFEELYMPSHPLCDWFGEEEFQDGFFEFKKGMRMLIYTDGVDNIHSDPKVKDRLFELLGKKNSAAASLSAKCGKNCTASLRTTLRCFCA